MNLHTLESLYTLNYIIMCALWTEKNSVVALTHTRERLVQQPTFNNIQHNKKHGIVGGLLWFLFICSHWCYVHHVHNSWISVVSQIHLYSHLCVLCRHSFTFYFSVLYSNVVICNNIISWHNEQIAMSHKRRPCERKQRQGGGESRTGLIKNRIFSFTTTERK